jgi:hypothetical protein
MAHLKYLFCISSNIFIAHKETNYFLFYHLKKKSPTQKIFYLDWKL